MNRIRLIGLLCAVVLTSVPTAAERASHDFEGHNFTLQLPPGYFLHGDPASGPGLRAFGFGTDLRNDGTRGMMQVILLDFNQVPAGGTTSLDQFAETMIGGVRRRRTQWQQTATDVEVDGVRAKRIEWSGVAEAEAGGPPVHMRGLMIVGIMKDLGFSLVTQDVVPFADTSLPECEQALKTFTLTPRH